MARPVAMSSNLHSVLFVPQSGLIRVAQADNHRPAVDCAFEEYDLGALLAESRDADFHGQRRSGLADSQSGRHETRDTGTR
jgi:hypothetical protein